MGTRSAHSHSTPTYRPRQAFARSPALRERGSDGMPKPGPVAAQHLAGHRPAPEDAASSEYPRAKPSTGVAAEIVTARCTRRAGRPCAGSRCRDVEGCHVELPFPLHCKGTCRVLAHCRGERRGRGIHGVCPMERYGSARSHQQAKGLAGRAREAQVCMAKEP